jgi:hypothetical protein
VAGFGRNTVVAWTGLAWALVTLGCADGGADHLLLDRFFAASRLRDRTALARFSTVIFEPLGDGVVERFTVLGTTDPQPLTDVVLGQGAGEPLTVARLSLDVDVQDGVPVASATLVSREISVRAQVRAQRHDVRERIVLVTVQRGESRGQPERVGRWIVTGVR